MRIVPEGQPPWPAVVSARRRPADRKGARDSCAEAVTRRVTLRKTRMRIMLEGQPLADRQCARGFCAEAVTQRVTLQEDADAHRAGGSAVPGAP
jgi:hypothetical protein